MNTSGVGGRWVCLLAVFMFFLQSGCTGCSRDASAAQTGPYWIAEIEVVGEHLEWAPDSEQVEHWFRRALSTSDRGISAEKSGTAMRAAVHHRLLVIERPQGATLRIDVDVQLEAIEVDPEGGTLFLSAATKYRHPFSVEAPSEALLAPLSQTLLREAVESLVFQLRDQAVVRQTLTKELSGLILEEGRARSARLLAIEEVVFAGEKGAEEALLAVAFGEDLEVAMAAARALHSLKAPSASRALMRVAQQMSRDRHYEEYLELLPLLAEFEQPWVQLYLETVAEAHRLRRVRESVRGLLAPPEPSKSTADPSAELEGSL